MDIIVPRPGPSLNGWVEDDLNIVVFTFYYVLMRSQTNHILGSKLRTQSQLIKEFGDCHPGAMSSATILGAPQWQLAATKRRAENQGRKMAA